MSDGKDSLFLHKLLSVSYEFLYFSCRGWLHKFQKVNDHNVPVKTVTFRLLSLTLLPPPLCISQAMRGSSV